MNIRCGSRAKACLAALVLLLALLHAAPGALIAGEGWLSPAALVAAPDGRTLHIACATGQRVLAFDVHSRKVTQSIAMPHPATGLAISCDGRTLFVACAAPESQVCVVDVEGARIRARLAAGHTAMSPVLSPDGKTLYVCNRFNNDVSVFDLAAEKELRRIPVEREPVAAAITRDGQRLLVANHLHHGRADAEYLAAVVSVVDTVLGQCVENLRLPHGSGSLNDIRVSPDGRYAVVTHLMSRSYLPTTQLERGWMNTNVKTLIDLARMQVLNTVLLDAFDRGAAVPWGVAWSADGQKLVVTLSGTHEISVTDFPALVDKLARVSSAGSAHAGASEPDGSVVSQLASDVPNDLSFLVGVRQRQRLPEGDLGPRAVAVAGRYAYTANYFSDTLTAFDLASPRLKGETITLAPAPEMTLARRGELCFHDARICFQGWQSCASCHPGDARMDALNWDLLNDGIGNPKNNKSLLLCFETPPAMSMGVRETPEEAVRAGIRHILFTEQPPAVAEAMDAYLRSLKPVQSPHLVEGQLSEAAKRGERIFRNVETGCARCHPAPLFTDLRSYDVGTSGPFDMPCATFDTPTLVELWRTAPYLHDGSAATVHDVLTRANKNDHHGNTSRLTSDQLNDLIEYLLSL